MNNFNFTKLAISVIVVSILMTAGALIFSTIKTPKQSQPAQAPAVTNTKTTPTPDQQKASDRNRVSGATVGGALKIP